MKLNSGAIDFTPVLYGLAAQLQEYCGTASVGQTTALTSAGRIRQKKYRSMYGYITTTTRNLPSSLHHHNNTYTLMCNRLLKILHPEFCTSYSL